MTQTDKARGYYPTITDSIRIADALEDANMINMIINNVVEFNSIKSIRMYLQEKYEQKIIDRVDYKYKEYSEYMRR